MEQVNSNPTLAMLQTIASQAQLPKTGKSDAGDDFQKLLDQKTQSTDSRVEKKPKIEKTTAAKKSDGQQEDEDPAEASKRLQVYLVPVSPEELSQYPASWLPQGLEEGEPVVCIGVHTGKDGEQIPTLVGANTAAKMYGKPVVAPEQMRDVSDPEADAMLESTAPGADNSPAALLDRVVADQFGKVVKQAAQEGEPQAREGGDKVEITDVEQAPQRIFHDVKAAPVKVGEVYDAKQTDEPDAAQQLDARIAQALQRGESTVQVKLNPENLGEVTVNISMKSGGVLAVSITARSDETRTLLERHSANLQQLLSSRVRETVEVDVQRQQESQQSQDQHPYDGHNGHSQGGQEERRQRRDHTGSQDFVQQLRLGLIPTDGEGT